jgi:hypothetical protein
MEVAPSNHTIAISVVRLSTNRRRRRGWATDFASFFIAARRRYWTKFRTIRARTRTSPSARMRVGVSRKTGATPAGPLSHRKPVCPSMMDW